MGSIFFSYNGPTTSNPVHRAMKREDQEDVIVHLKIRHPAAGGNLVQLHLIVEKPHEKYLNGHIGGNQAQIKLDNACAKNYISTEYTLKRNITTYTIPNKAVLYIEGIFYQIVDSVTAILELEIMGYKRDICAYVVELESTDLIIGQQVIKDLDESLPQLMPYDKLKFYPMVPENQDETRGTSHTTDEEGEGSSHEDFGEAMLRMFEEEPSQIEQEIIHRRRSSEDFIQEITNTIWNHFLSTGGLAEEAMQAEFRDAAINDLATTEKENQPSRLQ